MAKLADTNVYTTCSHCVLVHLEFLAKKNNICFSYVVSSTIEHNTLAEYFPRTGNFNKFSRDILFSLPNYMPLCHLSSTLQTEYKVVEIGLRLSYTCWGQIPIYICYREVSHGWSPCCSKTRTLQYTSRSLPWQVKIFWSIEVLMNRYLTIKFLFMAIAYHLINVWFELASAC